MVSLETRSALVLAVLVLVIVSTLGLTRPAAPQPTLPPIIIQPDGSVSPDTAPIQLSGNTYTFTSDLYGAVKILKSNVILDGAGHTLRGSFSGKSTDVWVVGTGTPGNDTLDYYTIGVDLGGSDVGGVTVENLRVENFSIGMYIWTQNNTVVANTASNNIVGLLISGSNDTITQNYISGNLEGLFFGSNSESTVLMPPDIVVYENAFVHNKVQISGCVCKNYNLSEAPHDWDNGKVGNFWSDYNGTDTNHDGFGETPYTIDILNRDRYPLMLSPVKPISSAAVFPVQEVVVGVSIGAIVVAAGAVVFRRRRNKA